ncbi:class I tRNA ligase family protein, partial [Mycoplasmopsis bovis]|uniref:class I tRNA ligase family protein n=1 Tax=Mycoplasmopsis bovis TaxID=28903 RepID=UPI003D29F454
FSFLGWPASDELLKRYYPTNLLVTGYDIIFFWDELVTKKNLNESEPYSSITLTGSTPLFNDLDILRFSSSRTSPCNKTV